MASVPLHLQEERIQQGRERGLSVVIPAMNEEMMIETFVVAVRQALSSVECSHEILVVDDGSTDRTAELASRAGARVVSLPTNCGYGAAIKKGIAAARYQLVALTDGDGTYPADAIPQLLAHADRYDMVVGARTLSHEADSAVRRHVRAILRILAEYLAGRHIPDLNSGLRIVDRKIVERFWKALPSGFSFTSTLTLAALCNGLAVHYHPVHYLARVGQSKVRPMDGIAAIRLILRTTIRFAPHLAFARLGLILVPAVFALYGLAFGEFLWSAGGGLLGGGVLLAQRLRSARRTPSARKEDPRSVGGPEAPA